MCKSRGCQNMTEWARTRCQNMTEWARTRDWVRGGAEQNERCGPAQLPRTWAHSRHNWVAEDSEHNGSNVCDVCGKNCTQKPQKLRWYRRKTYLPVQDRRQCPHDWCVDQLPRSRPCVANTPWSGRSQPSAAHTGIAEESFANQADDGTKALSRRSSHADMARG